MVIHIIAKDDSVHGGSLPVWQQVRTLFSFIKTKCIYLIYGQVEMVLLMFNLWYGSASKTCWNNHSLTSSCSENAQQANNIDS